MAGRSLADLFVTVIPDMDKFEPELRKKLNQVDRTIERQSHKSGEKIGRGYSDGIGRTLKAGIGTAMVAVAASVATIGLGSLFKSFIEGAQESARVARVTAAVIKSTGGAARTTAAQVGDLAQAISNKTGADDEAIQSGANLLLTFTNIRNGVGKGNDIFNRATATITDMTAALNNGQVTSEGLKTSSIQLGKALNDPIKGITALQRVGVSFTAKQKEQIQSFVDSGKTMEAQKIILGELSREFGGAAVAAADPLTRLKTIAGNLGEDIGTLLLPYIAKFADFLSNKAIPAVERFIHGPLPGLIAQLRVIVDGVKAMIGAFKEGDVTSTGFIGRMERVGVALQGVTRIIGQFLDWFQADLMPALEKAGKEILPVLRESLDKVRAAFSGNGEGGKQLITVLKVLGVVLTQAVIPILTFVIKVLLKEWARMMVAIATGIRKVVIPALGALATIFLDVTGVMLNAAAKAFGWIPKVGDKLKDAARNFNNFRADVNRSIDGITKAKTVTIGAKVEFPKDWQSYRAGERMATGGRVYGAGGPTDDKVPAMLSNGEHVWTAREVNAAGGHGAVEDMRRGVLGFADGGGVGVRTALPGGSVINGAMARIEGALETFAVRFGNFLQKQIGVNPSLTGALRFARAQVGKPYIWGSAGPSGYDCSGFISALLNVVQGRSTYMRRGTTGTFPWDGFTRGPGAFMVGSFRGSPGHMAGTINGVNVESRGSRGPTVGAAARGARNGLFGGNIWHLKGYAQGGPVGGGDLPFDIFSPRGKEYNPKLKNILGPLVFDRGGFLPPGLSLAYNGTGAPERVGSGGVTLVLNNSVVTTNDVDNWLTQRYDRLRAKGRVP